jgi:hypothetical protein
LAVGCCSPRCLALLPARQSRALARVDVQRTREGERGETGINKHDIKDEIE